MCWADSDEFLLSPHAFGHPLYLVQTRQRGIGGIALMKVLRQRTDAGIVALSRRPQAELPAALDAGADIVLPLSAPAAHVLAAVRAVQRRCAQQSAQTVRAALPVDLPWTLQPEGHCLLTPDGTRVVLSASELVVMRILAQAPRHRVERRELLQQLWGEQAGEMDNALQAMLYRLRRRIEQASRWPAPVHAVARVGYEFRAPLKLA
ncbi:winged helix-turn-helix domain-containing protein [Aquincola tertiaricarbonis]|uniref:Winged helix-turn-helix domain-containing protein n=1 Tax=Aquincola tertiaricarbonis TaxID=391953 RepID=A0ABY4S1F2_AQUTE|nr:winged helix-turn-helix domain-containing protein [Aquincola tertiaricarbonis]URI06400.1 winged helix-turn-helix domain-containing protein [Aquincola tertiaricarbonis]